jgi:hypothetical protein
MARVPTLGERLAALSPLRQHEMGMQLTTIEKKPAAATRPQSRTLDYFTPSILPDRDALPTKLCSRQRLRLQRDFNSWTR